MAQTDKSSYVTTTLAQILTACTLVKNALGERDTPELADELLTIYSALDDLLELALPTPSEGQLHGLPKKATTTHFSTLLFRHVDNPDWDYRTWFAEKTIKARDYLRQAVQTWQDFREEPTPELCESLSRHIDNCQTYAGLVYQEVLNGRIEIKELSSD